MIYPLRLARPEKVRRHLNGLPRTTPHPKRQSCRQQSGECAGFRRPSPKRAEYREALRIDPAYAEAQQNLEAARPDLASMHYNACVEFANQGRTGEAGGV